jgi:hypothetical protein
MLLLVPTLTDDSAMPREREDHSVLLTMMVNRRGRMWFCNHPRGAYVWSQADQCIRSLHALRLSAGDLERRAFLDDDWLLFLHLSYFCWYWVVLLWL